MVLILRPPAQMREQDVKLERNIARLEALSFAHISAKATLTTASRTGDVPCLTHPAMPHGAAPATRRIEHEGQDELVPPEHSLRENLSVAHRFYRELRAFANSNSSSTRSLVVNGRSVRGMGDAAAGASRHHVPYARGAPAAGEARTHRPGEAAAASTGPALARG